MSEDGGITVLHKELECKVEKLKSARGHAA